VKGYPQVEGVNFYEILYPIAMSLDATFDIEIKKMNVKKKFLHGDLE
jgi:hypothetical protein